MEEFFALTHGDGALQAKSIKYQPSHPAGMAQ